MLDAVGLEVVDLVRTSIGDVRVGRLKAGAWRVLKPVEVRDLLAASSALH
jgi:16S rRNA U516 pseudouridylate synthase RsuA-like enzyme